MSLHGGGFSVHIHPCPTHSPAAGPAVLGASVGPRLCPITLAHRGGFSRPAGVVHHEVAAEDAARENLLPGHLLPDRPLSSGLTEAPGNRALPSHADQL